MLEPGLADVNRKTGHFRACACTCRQIPEIWIALDYFWMNLGTFWLKGSVQAWATEGQSTNGEPRGTRKFLSEPMASGATRKRPNAGRFYGFASHSP